MAVVHAVVGLMMLGLGTFLIVRREALPIRRGPAARSAAVPPTLWIYLGVMFLAVGLLQLLLALV